MELLNMKITSIMVKDSPPINHFQVDSLMNTVVLAGPNGVGKTRLIQHILTYLQNTSSQGNISVVVEPTCDEEREAWGQNQLSTAHPDEANKFNATLRANQLRRNLKSSVINFESDRTIQAIKPYNFTWDMQNPYEEQLGWNTTFSFMRNRFQDTLHSMFRIIEYQKRNIANRAIQLRKDGKTSMALKFSDPMEPFKNVFSELLAPKILVDPNPKTQKLEYEFNGSIRGFESLSSGEREVVNVAFDFLLRRPNDCVIFFDEPELHLHPELSYKLIRTLQNIGERNQFIFCTHSPDIISSALEQSVIFLAPPENDPSGTISNQARVVSENDETNQALRLLGHSMGVIPLGKKIVLIEGDRSSLDKQTYGSIVGKQFPQLVLVPSGGKDLIRSFNLISEKVLDKTLWGVEFFMLCDRDSIPLSAKIPADTNSKLRVIGRYHIENYFLDENVWAKVFEHMEPENSWLRSPEQIRKKMLEIAKNLVSYSVALSISSELRMIVGNVDLMPKKCYGKSVTELQTLVSSRIETERERVENSLDVEPIINSVEEQFQHIQKSLDEDTDDWQLLLPGRPLLGKFVGFTGLGISQAKTMYIRDALNSSSNPFQEITDIFAEFANYKPS